MRVILTGGGTGGHIYPALAVARYLKEKEPESEILFIGTRKGLESKIVPKAGFELKTITARGLPRELSPRLLRVFPDVLSGGFEARRIIREFNPQVVLGTGGYVCGPVVMWAHLLGVPALIHEQNVIPGVTNKILSRFAKKVCISFEASKEYLSSLDNVVFTGNPRASEVFGANRKEGIKALGLNPNKKTVLIVGGSQGAQRINESVMDALEELKSFNQAQFIYITGHNYYERVLETARKKGAVESRNILFKPYVEEMPLALAASDLIVSRAGATTLAEITALGIPSILIPSPNVTNNHQLINARVLSENGAAELVAEDELKGSFLTEKIFDLLQDQNRLDDMAESSRSLGVPYSTETIYSLLKEVII